MIKYKNCELICYDQGNILQRWRYYDTVKWKNIKKICHQNTYIKRARSEERKIKSRTTNKTTKGKEKEDKNHQYQKCNSSYVSLQTIEFKTVIKEYYKNL